MSAQQLLVNQWTASSDQGRSILRSSLAAEVRILRRLVEEVKSRRNILNDCRMTLLNSIERGIQFLSEDTALLQCIDL